jgi:hypothetical protein
MLANWQWFYFFVGVRSINLLLERRLIIDYEFYLSYTKIKKMNANEVSKSIGYCGLVCRLCHLADKCDGCKSNKNCCAKHLSEKGCYQYNCCVEKNINGCW